MSALNKLLTDRKIPILCYVTDRLGLETAEGSAAIPALLQKIQELILAGVDWVQIREKDLPAKELSSLTREALRYKVAPLVSAARRPRILVNDRLDVALAEQTDGVHLSEKSLPPADVRSLLHAVAGTQKTKQDFLVGVSCHSVEAARVAADAKADYIFFGPIFGTPSKAQYGAPQGLRRLEEICHAVNIPVIAIGGITVENAGACVAAGAKGVAAIRLFQGAEDPKGIVRALQELRF